MQALPSNLREFSDTHTARNWLYESTMDALNQRFPVEDDQLRLELRNLKLEPKTFSLSQQKDALLKNRQLRVPVKGTWRLVDKKSGTVLDERDDTLMQLPYLTERGTVVYNGNEYSSVSQSRLKPGTYVRVRKSGEPEAFFNIRPRTGHSFRLWMQPDTGVFRINVGQANIPLYTLLKATGAEDRQLLQQWGPEITEANIRAAKPQDLHKLYERFAGLKAVANVDDVTKHRTLVELLNKSEMDPDVVARTLGIPDAKGVNSGILLRAAQKMLNVSRKEEEPDDRDAPKFSNVLSIEDLIPERISNDAGHLARTLLWKIRRDRTLERMPPAALNPYVDDYLFGSRLTMPLEETNPLSILEQMSRVTKLGEGGISSAESITDEARNVNVGQFGFIDPVTGPEGCFTPDMQVMTRTGWMTWPDVTPETELACNVNGKLEYHIAFELQREEYDGVVYECNTKAFGFSVTPSHRLWLRTDDARAQYRPEFPTTMIGARRLLCGGHQAYSGQPDIPARFSWPAVEQPGNAYQPLPSISWDTFGRFIGWYVSEGSYTVCTDGQIQVSISTHDELVADELRELFEELDCAPQVNRDATGQVHAVWTVRRQLGEYVQQFGRCADKYLPAEIFELPESARIACLDCLCRGDGRKKGATYHYCTTSKQLALDVERLAFGLGYSVRVRWEPDDRPQSLQGGTWIVALHLMHERQFKPKVHVTRLHYDGQVYCATVPGGLLYVRKGTYGGHWSGNLNIGIDVRTAFRTFKGRDRQLYAEFNQPSSGKSVFLRPEDLDGKVIAFPGEMENKQSTATAVQDGKIVEVSKKKVDLVVPSFAHMSSAATLLNPMPTGYQPARAFYGAKFWSQYMPQAQGEIPLVDSVLPGEDTTVSEYYGRMIGTLKSDVGGMVTRVTPDSITIRDESGEAHKLDLVKHFPFNRLTGISYFPTVQRGDMVKPGQMLAHSNFTDPKTGSLTMGQNLKVAMIPYKGKSYEDAYVISEAAAQKLATERLYGFDQDAKHGVELGRNKYASLFPDTFTKEQLAKLDDNGVAQKGTVLEKGDPIILAVGPKLLGPEDMQLGRLHKALRHAFTDKATIWDHDYPGMVVDTVTGERGARVNIAAQVPVRVGDKLSTRYGLKGVVGTVVPVDQMPKDASTNAPYDLLLNPMGILSRVAPSQLAEMQLGKIAKRTGKQFRIPIEPPEEGWNTWTLNQLKQHGIPEEEPVFDPELGRNLPPVATGYTYVMAFHHLGEKKLSDRGSTGVGYTADEQPSRGGGETQQAKKMSQMDMTALLAHGATEVIKDAQVIRGAKNDEFWKALKLGLPLPEPQVPFVYNKFLNMLKAGGINIREKGNTMTLLPMTDDDVMQLSRGKISNSGIVDDNLQPIKGGLFDVGKTGGLPGRFWSHVELNEAMPNPVFEEPIRRLLGLTQKEYMAVLSGAQPLNGLTGGPALQQALKGLDIDQELAAAKAEAYKRRGSARDNAIKKIGYLMSAKKQGIHPVKWMITKIPVLPPTFRAVSRMGDVTLQADINELYRDLIESNSALASMRKEVPDSALVGERATLYNAISAVYGLGDPITPEGRSKRLKGAIRQVIGDSPKTGLFQSRVLSKPVDVVGRGVVTPDPNLDMDSIGIPEDSAWKLYKDFVIRHLVRRNIPAHKALEMVKNRDTQARSALEAEMRERPVIMDRAPTWHKFNLLAFYPHISEGTTVRVSPLITKGFTMDFDGDAVNFHVPILEKSVQQAKERMLPSKNLFSLTDLRSVRHSPQQELVLGLYQLTQEPLAKPVRRFPSKAAALKAYRNGELRVNDPIQIG